MVKVNALGDACPIPVVKTKNAIKQLKGSGVVETLVDNEIAVQNLTKMANQKGYPVKSEKISDQEYRVEMTILSAGLNADQREADHEDKRLQATNAKESCIPDIRGKNTVVVISTNAMGHGDDELGRTLMKGFIYAISQQDELPATMLFYNGGAKLTCEDAPTLEDLKTLEAEGVEILTCGTCLNHYGLTEKLQVGQVTNMYVIAEKMTQASLIIKP